MAAVGAAPAGSEARDTADVAYSIAVEQTEDRANVHVIMTFVGDALSNQRSLIENGTGEATLAELSDGRIYLADAKLIAANQLRPIPARSGPSP